MTRNFKLFAVAMPVLLSLCGVARATVLFSDDFSNDTDTFAYPDSSSAHLPGPTSPGPGTWGVQETNSSQVQAGIIANTLPGGGTGGANGNANYMAISRPSGTAGNAEAIFSSPAGTSGTLSLQWDMYDVGPATFQIYLSETTNAYGDAGPFIDASYEGSGSNDMELATLTPGYNDLGGFPSDSWVHMDMEVNLTAQSYQLFVNNTLVAQPGTGQDTWGYNQPGGVGPFQSLTFYGGDGQGETLYVDNVNVNYAAPGGSEEWAPNSSGDWNVASNWNGGIVPNAIDAEADFFGAINSNHTIYTDAAITVGTINFNNANTYEITGTGSLTLQTSSGNAQVIVQAGTQEIDLPTTVASNTVFSVSDGATLVIANPITIDSGLSITQAGGGTVTYESTITVDNSSSIAFGSSTHAHALALQSNSNASISGAGTILELDSLSLASNAKLDLGTGQVNVDYTSSSPASSIAALLKSAYADGTWTGSGITSSSASFSRGTSVGYDDTGTQVQIKYTWIGDLNLNGVIDSTDLAMMGNIPATGPETGMIGWFDGDLNYDGIINADDYSLFAYGAAIAGNRNINTVPEPAILSLPILTIAMLSIRRRSR